MIRQPSTSRQWAPDCANEPTVDLIECLVSQTGIVSLARSRQRGIPMKKLGIVALAVIVLVGIAVAGFRFGWWNRIGLGHPTSVSGPGNATAGGDAPGASGNPAAAPGTPAGAASQPAASTAQAVLAPPTFEGNVAALDFGATVEKSPDTNGHSAGHQELIDGKRETVWETFGTGDEPNDVVLSFFAREPAWIDGIVVQAREAADEMSPRGLEVLVSMAGVDGPFTKVAAADLPQAEDVPVKFDPVEARFLKVRFLKSRSDSLAVRVADLKVHEAQRPGYVPLITRHPELVQPGGPGATREGLQATSAAVVMPTCQPIPPDDAIRNPAHPESKRVLVVASGPQTYGAYSRSPGDMDQRAAVAPEFSILKRVQTTLIPPDEVRPPLLSPALGYDTVVLSQVCDTAPIAGSFKQALMAWVAAGHKLIIQDSDECTPGPDYSFLPYPFKTDNPGAQGAKGKDMRFVEQNWMGHGRRGRPGFIDVPTWLTGTDLYQNELGDSNTVVAWDPHWCGHIAVRNVHDIFGFAIAYAHYGRGLVIYDGLDNDQSGTFGYDMLLSRELGLGFDPDNLPCAARLGDFVITTETALAERPMVPGRTYTYPLTLLSNQGYKGTVTLSLASSPGIEGLQHKTEPASVNLVDLAESTLTLALPGTARQMPVAVEVKGTDTAGKTSSLCLQLVLPKSGELAVVSAMHQQKVQKNLEIILDASGSMKTLLGKKSRWQTALDTLKQVVDRLPDDFNVGLRIYGHRESSRSPRTCTDSELVSPIEKLDRQAIMNGANSVKPKGETPLVYSVLQSPADLKAVGGGTVILITDGEESCKGDALKAAAELKASGLDVTLNIVGFALNNPQVQKQLGGFAQATGGQFYSAENGPALAQALFLAAVDKFPFTVYDASGKQVLAGEAGDAAEELPPGDYKVVVKAGNQEVVAPRVKVTLGQPTTLRIAVKNGALVLEQ
jgi:hypothetical protein